jgi:small subunit ribosomal protein S16
LSVKIRLKRMGTKKRAFYRIVATDSRNARDGRFIETLGYYDPMKDPAVVSIKEDLVFAWMERGAKPSVNTEMLLRKAGVMRKWALLRQGVSRDELDAKAAELKARETPPMSASEREQQEADRKAEAAAKAAEEKASQPEANAGEASAPSGS